MDFIKTSSLRALIELTFQRNWNGLIWMSRKGVTTKRVKTVQTALSRISAQTAHSGRPSTHHDPGSDVLTPCRARPCHASRENLAAAQPSRVPRPMRRPSRESYVPSGRETSANPSPVRPQRRPRIIRPRPFRSSDHDHTRSSGRSSRPTVRTPRSTRSPF
ncbi:unnamed protein product [Microthlaspi erraticum]|uniref:Uncharacterized protein n=1 Tax=Microthlaspi erraticum TaxID=1685480 RepID=A0A6D2IM40_9BRAS|nr:unnamed protein product [Microthlaspi erraticum]